MSEPVLVVLAAGMGSRFGGPKQLEGLDKNGHTLIDYSVYDAIRVGFRRVVFIIRKEIKSDFLSLIKTRRWHSEAEVDFAFQNTDIPALNIKRKKPWGTAHAVACLAGKVNSPFAIINADDFYGREAFRKIYGFIEGVSETHSYALVAYQLKNTLSKNGSVSRGVCQTEGGYLKKITETTGLIETNGKIFSADGNAFSPETSVSMNLWGFTPDIIEECKSRFSSFLNENLQGNAEKCEFYLPSVVSDLIDEGRARVRVLETNDKWYGITYREDSAEVSEALEKNILYPEIL